MPDLTIDLASITGESVAGTRYTLRLVGRTSKRPAVFTTPDGVLADPDRDYTFSEGQVIDLYATDSLSPESLYELKVDGLPAAFFTMPATNATLSSRLTLHYQEEEST